MILGGLSQFLFVWAKLERPYCFYFRRQKSTSWPQCRTCCDSVCSPPPSCSRSANSSPSSTTSCPGRPSLMSSRYSTELNKILHFTGGLRNLRHMIDAQLPLLVDIKPRFDISDYNEVGVLNNDSTYKIETVSACLLIFLTVNLCALLRFQTLSDLEPSLAYITDLATKVSSFITLALKYYILMYLLFVHVQNYSQCNNQ